MNDNGTVVFSASRAGDKGIFTGDGTTITTIIDITGDFSDLDGSPRISNRGTVLFRGELSSGIEGIFTNDGANITTIVDSNGNLTNFFGRPNINNKDTVIFKARATIGGEGLYISRGGVIEKLVDSTAMVEPAGEPGINDNDVAVFFGVGLAGADFDKGIFVINDQGLSRIIDSNGPFSTFNGAPGINTSETVEVTAFVLGGG